MCSVPSYIYKLVSPSVTKHFNVKYVHVFQYIHTKFSCLSEPRKQCRYDSHHNYFKGHIRLSQGGTHTRNYSGQFPAIDHWDFYLNIYVSLLIICTRVFQHSLFPMSFVIPLDFICHLLLLLNILANDFYFYL